MRQTFKGHFRPETAEFELLQKECLFAVDANVMLNFYRYSLETRKELEVALQSVEDRLFISGHAAEEFLTLRTSVTAGQAEEYKKVSTQISSLSSLLANKKKHPFLSNEILKDFDEISKKMIAELNSTRDKILDTLANDSILEIIGNLFNDRTGPRMSDVETAEIEKEGLTRYEKRIPPGYKDGNKDRNGDQNSNKYGDLIIWKQLISKSKEKSQPLIFITDDQKEDWWSEQSGRTIGPRPELREEFIRETGQNFWMYTTEKFMEAVSKAGNTKISQKAIAEIKEISDEESQHDRIISNLNFAQSLLELDNLSRHSHYWRKEVSPGRKLIIHEMVQHLGVDKILSSSDSDVINAITSLVKEIRATGMHPTLSLNLGALAGLSSIGLISDQDELTDYGLLQFKKMAKEFQ